MGMLCKGQYFQVRATHACHWPLDMSHMWALQKPQHIPSTAHRIPEPRRPQKERFLHLTWVRSPLRESKEESYLLVGTSTGHLQLHSSDAQLLHRQRLHARAITAITVRCAGMQAGSDDASEDITVCFEDAVARVSSLEVISIYGPLSLHCTVCLHAC